MRYLLALVFCVFTLPAGATDWVEIHRSVRGNQYLFFIDKDSIRSEGGHRLVWIKQTSDSIEGYEDYRLSEFDCAGRFMTHKAYKKNIKNMYRFDYGPQFYFNELANISELKKWYVIEPDTVCSSAEKAVCGK